MRMIVKHLSILFVFTLGLSLGQEKVQGSITYVSRDNAYMDLGKKAGVQIGDSVEVSRDSEILGVARVVQNSGSSSSLKALRPNVIGWEIGDLVSITSQPPEDQALSEHAVDEVAYSKQTTRQVFLDSSAYKPRKRSNMSLDPDRFSPSFSGYISTRYSERGGDSTGIRTGTGSLYGQFKVMNLGIRHLDVSMYLRSSQSSTDNQFETRLYSIMFSYARPDSPFSYLFGRLYHPLFSSLGTLDGLGVTWQSNRRTIAITGGIESPSLRPTTNQSRSKFGIIDKERFRWGNIEFGNITEIEAGELARNYLLVSTSIKFGRKLRVRGYSEFDLDVLDQSPTHNAISLTRFRTSMNWRAWRSLSSNLRYSYRENVIDLLDTAETEYDLAARHSLNTSLNWITQSGLSLSGQISLRGDGSDRQMKIYGLSLNHRNIFSSDLSFNSGAMAMYSYLSEGGRVYGSVGKRVLSWLDVDIYDELFFYQILGDTEVHTRHLPEISLSAKVPGLQRLRLRTRFEQEDGELLYRFSLSASRQF